eukprot:CAMPEP_0197047212 /NCGR_PEP_ID=MMETSP1384-20130603/22755_1 /TAXON_ID=29189 /ORGANISM="Ammonia sp." /LENGTH=48 /DNA_ID= /DNA_START= /DNA_END= /DNA_ORIENTATION=
MNKLANNDMPEYDEYNAPNWVGVAPNSSAKNGRIGCTMLTPMKSRNTL